jgi:VCBS repeat-containing protein
VATEDGGEEGTYFVDQSGHYYYQASSDQQPVMTVVSGKNQHFWKAESLLFNHEDGRSVFL